MDKIAIRSNNILQWQIIDALIVQAQRLRADGEYADAETIARKALERAEKRMGNLSLDTGLVLMELVELYDKQGREEESEPLWKRIREILLLASVKLEIKRD